MLVLGWRLGPQVFGVEVHNVVHIEENLKIRRVPRPLPGISGVVYYQAQIVPVLNLPEILLKEASHKWHSDSLYLVLQSGDQRYGGRVDSVLRIFSAYTDDLTTWADPPEHPAVPFVRAVLQTDQEMLWLIDVRRIARHMRLPVHTQRTRTELPVRQGA